MSGLTDRIAALNIGMRFLRPIETSDLQNVSGSLCHQMSFNFLGVSHALSVGRVLRSNGCAITAAPAHAGLSHFSRLFALFWFMLTRTTTSN
jgi:hypothetical protein